MAAAAVAAATGPHDLQLLHKPSTAPKQHEIMPKLLVTDRPPKRITGLQFGILSPQDIVSQSVVEVSDRHVYNLDGGDGSTRPVTRNGPMDRRMGVSDKRVNCETCDNPLKECNGHFGYVKLALPAFHVGYFKKIVDVLHCVCKECAHVLLDEQQRLQYLKSLRRPNLDNMQLDVLLKKIMADCRKRRYCPHCNAVNGAVRKVPGHALKIVHEKYRWYIQSTAKGKVPPQSKVEFDGSFDEAKKANPELEKHVKKAVDDLNPLRVLNLFRRVPQVDCELLGMKSRARPEMLIWQYVPAPPVSIRPSVAQDTASTEDDITNKLGDIVQISSIIKAGIEKGQPIQTIMEQWDYLQIQVAMYINSDVPNLQQTGFGKPIRGFCQRLKGKQGRFRGNLSGKRVDFSSRTVISPDPNLGIDEIAVPEKVAVTLTYKERVTAHNIEKLRACIRRGDKKHPGANFIRKQIPNSSEERTVVLSVFSRRQDKLDEQAKNLKIGDSVERHLHDGDIVLFNRQPSLHKLSILCHRVKVREWRTFRMNECVCNPYNADFDGDEMNLHVPQTEEARAEALELMGVKHNLATPKDGTPIIAAIQDFITAAYLLSSKERFYDRKTFAQICSYMFNGDGAKDPVSAAYQQELDSRHGLVDIDLPEPAILKPEALWTGKQVFNVLMRPSRKSIVKVNLDAACREHRPDAKISPFQDPDDTWLCIRNSEVMSGVMDKATLGAGNKDSIFYVIMRDFGPNCAVQAMNRLAKLSARWLANEGFSIGINDVQPGAILRQQKEKLVANAYDQCDALIEDFKAGKLGRDPGCNEEQTLEHRLQKVLNDVRSEAGKLCLEQLSTWNAPIIMAKSGSKGSKLNVSQMVAAVGQQIIEGERVADGFEDRTLPHFPKGARQPESKGFIRDSFFDGLRPTEFIFHAMSGREGLVDTAVKTAETGYMSRRLMKSLEDLSSQYDDTVRNSTWGIVQFQYGDDRLDPVDMEGKAKPVNFERSFVDAQTSEWSNTERGLLPFEIKEITNQVLEKDRAKLIRESLLGEKLPYRDTELLNVDQHESHRAFLDEVEEFVASKADRLSNARQHVGMKSAEQKNSKVKWANETKLPQAKLADGMAKISQKSLERFLQLCLTKYEKSKVQPGHAVGAVGAQSIGEPGTQMTLKTFHFAGVAGMSLTRGVPRIKEIINASKSISTPVIKCELYYKQSEEVARLVKGRIEKTYLRDVIPYISECWTKQTCYLRVKVDMNTIYNLQLDISMHDIIRALVKTRGLGVHKDLIRVSNNYINVYLDDNLTMKKTRGSKLSAKDLKEEQFIRLQNLKRMLPNVVIKGYPDAARAVVVKKLQPSTPGQDENELLVEGYGLKACMTTEGVNGYKTRTNSVMETFSVLGIEAARTTIVSELAEVMGSQMEIDPRHMQLLADVMTYKGEVLGITRFGLAKMRDSVLQLASFEKTPDHLFEAAVKGKEDKIQGVSECIIMGQSVRIGTGAMSVVRELGLEDSDFQRKPTLFEDAFKEYTIAGPVPLAVSVSA